MTKEVNNVFEFFGANYKSFNFKELIVAPFNLRTKVNTLIDTEIKNAQEGKAARIIIKMNNLVDPQIINKFYKASQAGVQIQLIIRGICSLIPGIKKASW